MPLNYQRGLYYDANGRFFSPEARKAFDKVYSAIRRTSTEPQIIYFTGIRNRIEFCYATHGGPAHHLLSALLRMWLPRPLRRWLEDIEWGWRDQERVAYGRHFVRMTRIRKLFWDLKLTRPYDGSLRSSLRYSSSARSLAVAALYRCSISRDFHPATVISPPSDPPADSQADANECRKR